MLAGRSDSVCADDLRLACRSGWTIGCGLDLAMLLVRCVRMVPGGSGMVRRRSGVGGAGAAQLVLRLR
jgi:hypothetical protein